MGAHTPNLRTTVINVLDTMVYGQLWTGTKLVKVKHYVSGKIFISQHIFGDFQAINSGHKFNDGINRYDSRPYKTATCGKQRAVKYSKL